MRVEAVSGPARGREPGVLVRAAPLVLGILALVAATALGWEGGLLEALVAPPALVRAALVGASAVAALWLLAAAVTRVQAGDRDLPSLVRGVRLAFLAVAAVAAGAGWLLAHPLPFVVALIIAGVDVIETTFLLLVVTMRGERADR